MVSQTELCCRLGLGVGFGVMGGVAAQRLLLEIMDAKSEVDRGVLFVTMTSEVGGDLEATGDGVPKICGGEDSDAAVVTKDKPGELGNGKGAPLGSPTETGSESDAGMTCRVGFGPLAT